MGVDNIITFDAHEPRVQNAIPLKGFETVQASYQFIKNLLATVPDVTIDSEMNIQIDGFLQFADYFFDNLFTDWAVLDEIHKSQQQVESTKEQIVSVLQKLQEMKEKAVEERTKTQEKLDELIVQVNV